MANAIIIGIDHGNGNMKTAKNVFPCGYICQVNEPTGIFAKDVVEYNGKYYTLTSDPFPYEKDKTTNEKCMILTLFAIAKEIKARSEANNPDFDWKRDFSGFVGKDVILAVGLPPAHYEKMQRPFKKYFMDGAKYGLNFTYNGKRFSFHLKDVYVYPQDYAAAVTFKGSIIETYSPIYCIDIGDGTADLLVLRDGTPDPSIKVSREIGMKKLREKIIDTVINDYSFTLDNALIEAVLNPIKKTLLDEEIIQAINREAADWAEYIVNEFHSKVPDFRGSMTIFTGGGSALLKPHLIATGQFGRYEFIESINANAIGYETLTEMILQ